MVENNEFENGIAGEAVPCLPGESERQWAMGCHLVTLVGYVMPFLFAGFFAPLIVWLLKRKDGPFVDEQGKESLNFQLSLLVYAFGCGLLLLVGIGALLLFPLMIFGFIYPIIATVKASDGMKFRYPMYIRFIK